MATRVTAVRRRIVHPRLFIAGLIVVVAAILFIATQNQTMQFPDVDSYWVSDQRTIEIAVYVAPCSWTRVTRVAESAAALAITVETLPCPQLLPGAVDLELHHVSVSLPDDLGQRAVTDSQGHEIPLRDTGS